MSLDAFRAPPSSSDNRQPSLSRGERKQEHGA
ncbi:hypothetical protein PcP3B5_27680 [Pseudomonas citronellolis]|nr:hypothetical protein PcP3B5_27680 [Pseudomonas citronellolis]